WEGHLGGFITGLMLAIILKTETPSSKKFDWEHEDYNEEADDFLKHFDEEGNFIETKPGADRQDEQSLKITYQYRPKEKREPPES
ncbi:MAG: rhomboid family intramembrane serine protease, partial [Maribacter sp.]|nr:rhomboid family intramembrane serine protease [Maribacter sp.]